jgi:parallel beta-helix repeat protein
MNVPLRNKRRFLVVCFILGINLVVTSTSGAIALSHNPPYEFLLENAHEKSTILYVGGDGPGNYTKIQDAIENAQESDTVFVYDDSSPYYENIVINKSINLIGENKNSTIIDANNSGVVVQIPCFVVGVTINGFTITNSGNNEDDAGVVVMSSNNTITRNIITNNKGTGILLFENSSFNTISCNDVAHNKFFGLELRCSDNNRISGNTILENGMVICSSGIQLSGSYNSITENVIARHKGTGIYIIGKNHNTITGNILTNFSNGIVLFYANNTMIFGNTIANNSNFGIYLADSSYNNTVYHNTFYNNRQNAFSSNIHTWNHGYPSGGNYWDDYEGSDDYCGPEQNQPGSDGIGDTPYELDIIDRYPFMEPDEWNAVCPILSSVSLSSGGLVTCPAGDGPAYQYTTVTVQDYDREPIPGVPAEEFTFLITPLGDTYAYGPLSCTFTPVDSQTNANGEIRFTIQGDTTIVGNISIQVTILGVSLNDVETLPCKSPDYFCDGAVILGDFIIFGQDYGKAQYRSDFTWDGMVNLLDFVMFGQHWGHHFS